MKIVFLSRILLCKFKIAIPSLIFFKPNYYYLQNSQKLFFFFFFLYLFLLTSFIIYIFIFFIRFFIYRFTDFDRFCPFLPVFARFRQFLPIFARFCPFSSVFVHFRSMVFLIFSKNLSKFIISNIFSIHLKIYISVKINLFSKIMHQ